MSKLSSLSIFFPTFNEEKNIEDILKLALKVGGMVSDKFEIIVINDGSRDQTGKIVQEYSKNYNQITLIEHKTNLGYGAALKTGFYSSKYEYITYMDADGQFNFEDLQKLVTELEDKSADIVIGFRIRRADNFIRVLNGKIWNILVGLLLNLQVKDIDCGFKLLKKKVLDDIPKLESNGATISAELLVKAKKRGFKIVQLGLNHRFRRFGNATGGNPIHILRAFSDLFSILPKL